MPRFEYLEHTADVGIAAYGDDLREAFANAAYGMFSLIAELDSVAEREMRNISLSASDVEGLLVDWLNELLFLFDAEGLLLQRFDITRLEDGVLEARVYGEKADPSRHELKMAVKAATYHRLKVERGRPCRVQVILDI